MKSACLLLLVGAGLCSSSWAADDGKALFGRNCGVCHVVSKSEPLRQGPYLQGVVGRKAGKIENFPYSNGLKAATFDWTPERLDQWITDPQSVIAGQLHDVQAGRPGDQKLHYRLSCNTQVPVTGKGAPPWPSRFT